jgi:hypothetical protein
VLIPYKRYSAPVAYELFKVSFEGGARKVLDRYQAVYETLCERTMYWMLLMFQVAFHLLVQSQFVTPAEPWQNAFILMVENYSDGLLGLLVDFYAAENQFLFGTSSQKRMPLSRQSK